MNKLVTILQKPITHKPTHIVCLVFAIIISGLHILNGHAHSAIPSSMAILLLIYFGSKHHPSDNI